MNPETFEIPAYKPEGLWCKHDFSINKHFWRKVGIEKATEIRVNNLVDIVKTLRAHGVENWLQGQSLYGIYLRGMLLDDHDDDLGLWLHDRDTVLGTIRDALMALGFEQIRETEDIVSFVRDFRYVDLCFFRKTGEEKVGYASKVFASRHFERLVSHHWKGQEFFVPSETEALLDAMYPDGPKVLTSSEWLPTGRGKAKAGGQGSRPGNRGERTTEKRRSGISRCVRIATRFPQRFVRAVGYLGRNRGKLLQMVAGKVLAIESRFGVFPTPVYNFILSFLGVEMKVLSESAFLNLLIEPEDSFNWKWRIKHLGPVTGEGKYRRIGEIVAYLSAPGQFEKISSGILETDTSFEFFPPTNYDMRFWWGGSNYFFYCVKYGFRRSVVPYSAANEYIRRGERPLLYTAAYYEGLDLMTDVEIENLLRKDPIEVTRGAVTSGKHRAFAMIGRLVEGRPYVPVRARFRS